MPEEVEHPSHYGGDVTYSPIKFITYWKLPFTLGNCVKYIVRAGIKGDRLTDLKKAQFYLNYEIELLEGKREV